MTKLQILGPLYSVLSVDIFSVVSVLSGEMMKNDRPGTWLRLRDSTHAWPWHGFAVCDASRQDAGKFGRTARPDTEPMRPVFRA